MGRLETVYKNSSLAEAYSYDGQGNRTSELNILRGVSPARSYSYDIEDKVVYAGADSYVFDTDGFLTSRTIASGLYSGTATFDYSSRGELLSASLPAGMGTITYTHDPMGRKIAKSVNGTVVEKYLWQDATTLLAVYDGSDTLLQRFEYADGRMPVAMTAGGQVYYFAYDQVGSLRVVTNANGTVVKRIDYDSFGNILADSNPSFAVPFGFAGGLHDRDTGLVRFGARDYDPMTGKWTAKDPIDFAGGDLNLLSYTDQDPVNWIDPLGLNRTINPWPASSGFIPFGPQITFVNNDPCGDSPNQPVSEETANMIERAVVESGVNTVNINSTTGGIHDPNSRHPLGMAADFNLVNGAIANKDNEGARKLQDALNNQGNVRENYGPFINTKTVDGIVTQKPKMAGSHTTHIHVSGQQ